MLADDGGMVLNRRRRIRCSSDRASLVAPVRPGRSIQRRLAILAFWRSVGHRFRRSDRSYFPYVSCVTHAFIQLWLQCPVTLICHRSRYRPRRTDMSIREHISRGMPAQRLPRKSQETRGTFKLRMDPDLLVVCAMVGVGLMIALCLQVWFPLSEDMWAPFAGIL